MNDNLPGNSASEPHWLDPVIDAYKLDVDRTLIQENLRLTVDERLKNLEALLRDAEEMRRAVQAANSGHATEAK